MKILIVDDDPTARVVLEKILKRYGLTDCEFAIDGQNAVENFTNNLNAEQPYGLIFLDVKMPNKNGINTIQEIRAIERARRINQDEIVKVVIITSSNDNMVLADAYEALCDGYILKPYHLSVIVDQLKALGIPIVDK
jgi:two-component system chemotaxis response regulator CheY